jgi:protein-L-isoaspartate O-methyltransferase
MVENLKRKSSFAVAFQKNILESMLKIPRHLFYFEEMMTGKNAEENNACAYNYKLPIPASTKSTCSSPEVCALQLSMLKLELGYSVLFWGAKSGYIQSIAAQIIGVQGRVLVASANKDGLTLCKKRITELCPLRFQHIFSFLSFPSVKEMEILDNYPLSNRVGYDAIIIAGAIREVPERFLQKMLNVGGAFIAPIGEPDHQNFVYGKRDSFSKLEYRLISDWGVRFGQLEHQ